MKTLMIYIQKTEKMSEHYKAFFQREIDRGIVQILEYRWEKEWDDKLMEQICADMEKCMSGCQEWKLLLADDWKKVSLRRKFLKPDSFRKRFIQYLDWYFNREGCMVTLPVSAFIIAYSDEKDIPCIKSIDVESEYARNVLGERTRTLIYFGERQKELPYECRRIIYFLLLLYYILYDISIDCYSSYEICSLTAEWDWDGFHKFLEQMKNQYREMEIKCNESYVDTQSFEIPPVYADAYSSLRVIPETEYKGATWESRIHQAKKTAMEKHDKLLEKAEKSFEKLKQIYWRYDYRVWNSEEFRKQIEPYEAELNRLFAEGADNYEEIMDRIEKLDDIAHDFNKHGSFAWILADGALAFFLLSIIYQLPSHCYIIAGIVVFLLVMISERRVLPASMKTMMQNGLDEVDKMITADADRMNQEFALMVEYRDGYHRYYEWLDNQENQQAINHSISKMLYRIGGRKRWLEELGTIAQLDQVKRYETRYRTEMTDMEEGLYYPVGWKREDALRVSEEKTVPFPYPFIRLIKMTRLTRSHEYRETLFEE